MFLIDSWLWLKAKKIKNKPSADTQIPGLHMLNKHHQQHFVTRGGSAENTMMLGHGCITHEGQRTAATSFKQSLSRKWTCLVGLGAAGWVSPEGAG